MWHLRRRPGISTPLCRGQSSRLHSTSSLLFSIPPQSFKNKFLVAASFPSSTARCLPQCSSCNAIPVFPDNLPKPSPSPLTRSPTPYIKTAFVGFQLSSRNAEVQSLREQLQTASESLREEVSAFFIFTKAILVKCKMFRFSSPDRPIRDLLPAFFSRVLRSFNF